MNIANATSPTYTLEHGDAADNGAMFRARRQQFRRLRDQQLRDADRAEQRAPTGTITAPVNGTNYRGGQTFTFAGTGTDPEDGTLPAERIHLARGFPS